MTSEERLDRMEQLHSQHMEMSRQDRAAYIAWKRDMESQVSATWQAIERTSKGLDDLRAQSQETDRRLKELGEATDARIEKLVGAIGELIRRRPNGEA